MGSVIRTSVMYFFVYRSTPYSSTGKASIIYNTWPRFCTDLYVPIVEYPVTETAYGKELEMELQHIRQFVKMMLIKKKSHVRRQSCEQPA